MSRLEKYEYLDGHSLRDSILASAKKISRQKDHLNDINVFPVPDGDTGTNMVDTMDAIAESTKALEFDSFSEMSNAIADSALEGARGNSGVILAQFFQGLADESRGKDRLQMDEFADAVMGAVRVAETAVNNPREGTILTVMRDWAIHLKEHAKHHTDFGSLFRDSLGRARESLSQTTQKLKELRRAKVVDAGALGFVHILEGISDVLEGGAVRAVAAGTHMVERVRHHTHSPEETAKFRYCTQCLVSGTDIDRSAIRAELLALGDSLIVIGSKRKVRVHVHSNEPDRVFEIVAGYGELTQTKMEDMRKQVAEKLKGSIALVTDSTCDIPDDVLAMYNITMVPLHLHVMNREYVDREDITADEFYELFKRANYSLSTSQPSLSSFTQAYERLAAEHESILSIHVTSKLSGTGNGARLAARSFSRDTRIEIVDAKSTTVLQGMIVIEAARMIESGLTLDEILPKLEAVIRTSGFYVGIPDLKHAVRMGRVPKAKGFIGQLLNIKPVITFDEHGGVKEAVKVRGQAAVEKKVLAMIIEHARHFKAPRFAIAHVQNQPLAEQYAETLRETFSTEDVYITAAAPVLGAHVGFGTCAVAAIDADAE